MIDPTDPKKGSGRTTRMLQHAIKCMQANKQAIVFARDNKHVQRLVVDIRELVCSELGPQALEKEYEHPILILSFPTVVHGNHITPRGWSHFDYASNTFRTSSENTEYLIDHAALEYHLHYVTGYLRATDPIKDQTQWLLDTARVMAELGRRVYLVTDDEQERDIAAAALEGYNVSVESPESLANFDPVTIQLGRAHPNVQLLVDPAMMRRMFNGAINEMTRWDK